MQIIPVIPYVRLKYQCSVLVCCLCSMSAWAELQETISHRITPVPTDKVVSFENNTEYEQKTASFTNAPVVASDNETLEQVNAINADTLIVPNDELKTDTSKQNDTWIDDTHKELGRWLSGAAYTMDDWFGRPNSDKPAWANIRLMLDVYHNTYDGETIKPRIRARLKLPTLEQRLSLMIGDDDLDNQPTYAGGNATDVPENDNGRRFDRKQSREENTSLALRWSKLMKKAGMTGDIDLGVRGTDDVYLRLRMGRQKALGNDWQAKAEQIYRYGSQSEHYARTNVLFERPILAYRKFVNHSHLEYTHDEGVEAVHWGNSLHQTHTQAGKLGNHDLSYGIYASGRLDEGQTLNSYGPFIHYRQPIWREWIFLQGELSYYNNKLLERDHHLASFLRVEMVF